jgi:DNA-binding response OmpR family regulator
MSPDPSPSAGSTSQHHVAPPAPCGVLPASAQVLYVTTSRHPAAELRELLATDGAMSVAIEETDRAGCAIRLRQQAFDAVLVAHGPPELDALELARALRAAGDEVALLIAGDAAEADFAALCHEAGADAYLAWPLAPRHLLWAIERAIEWRRLLAENRRLSQAHQQRLRLEHNEAERLLDQQRALLDELQELSGSRLAAPVPSASPRPSAIKLAGVPRDLANEWLTDYQALLRAYVIMGSGNLGDDIASLAGRFATADLSARDVMRLHVHAVEGLLASLGKRGARHAMTRADLLVLEVMMHLAESYRVSMT